ncbi:uncharacterized protein BX664DRAFT_379302 [Halteromyces radiatus]|uniref:uncharacterized protein n=1 Tax=Halteromyces radiatus TaxID=101107 RepID=UPI00221E8C57|nr:uncharacterized protein BX664DRAFT_379302 [Halteromyces radiatus]KAI8089383.1 hypothetical protein BX664DRAFT_379302 [Halteromyces radiatus]
MPKLKYKSKKSHKHKTSSKKKRRQHYSPPYIYEQEPPPQAFKKTEEQEWQEKLFEAMVDEEDPFYTFYDTNSGPSTNDPHYMSDDAYADYINQGMYRKQHAEELAQQEARRQARAKRRQEREEANRKLEQEHLEQLKRHERIRQEETQQRLKKYLEQYTLQWNTFNNNKIITSLRDIPWPTLGSRITRDNVRAFLIHHTPKQIRQEQLRYHPDKFIPRIKSIFKGSEKDLDWIQRKDNEVSGWLNELWTERNES